MFGRFSAIAEAALTPIEETQLGSYSTFTVIVTTIAVFLLFQKTWRTFSYLSTPAGKDKAIENSVKLGIMLPYVGPKIKNFINGQLNEVFTDIKKEIDETRSRWTTIPKLPQDGVDFEVVKNEFDDINTDYHHAKVSGAVYTEYSPEIKEALASVFSKTNLTNPLHSHWPKIHKMKSEIISWCQNFLNNQSGAHGVITHGGSTSIYAACFAYVRFARQKGISRPEILVPESAHPAFEKAAEFVGAVYVAVPVDKNTCKADVKAMRKAITSNTCMIVGSAPSYPFGIIDPIPEIAALAAEYNIFCHVDGCLGGPQTAFARKAGFAAIPACDFSVPGVSSVSFDTHKYLECPKGSSFLGFRPGCPASPSQGDLEHMCGLYYTDTMDGSDGGDRIAILWANLMLRGEAYFVKNIGRILQLQRALVEALKRVEGFEVPFDPQLSVIGFRVKKGYNMNPLIVAQKFAEKGWAVNIVKTPDKKEVFHFCLTAVHANHEEKHKTFIKDFVADLNEAVQYALAHPTEKPKGMAKAYGKMKIEVPNLMQGRIKLSIPRFVLDQIGDGYVKLQNAVTGYDVPGIFNYPRRATENMEPATPMPQTLRPS